MSIKEWREQNPGTFNLIAAGFAAVALLIAAYNLGYLRKDTPVNERPVAKVYFYDLNKGEVFVGDDCLPPVPAPSGPIDGKPAGVIANVFSCGDCADASTRFVGYLETIDEKFRAGVDPTIARGYYNAPSPTVVPGLTEATLVKLPEDKTWVSKSSADGAAVMSAHESKCPAGTVATGCNP